MKFVRKEKKLAERAFASPPTTIQRSKYVSVMLSDCSCCPINQIQVFLYTFISYLNDRFTFLVISNILLTGFFVPTCVPVLSTAGC